MILRAEIDDAGKFLQLLLKACRARVLRGGARRLGDDEHFSLAVEQRVDRIGGEPSSLCVVRQDLSLDEGTVLDRLVDGHDLGPAVGELLHRRDQRLRVGRHDNRDGGRGRRNRVDHRDLAVGGKLVWRRYRERKAKLLRLRLRATGKRLVERTSLHAEHERDGRVGRLGSR